MSKWYEFYRPRKNGKKKKLEFVIGPQNLDVSESGPKSANIKMVLILKNRKKWENMYGN